MSVGYGDAQINVVNDATRPTRTNMVQMWSYSAIPEGGKCAPDHVPYKIKSPITIQRNQRNTRKGDTVNSKN